MKKQAREILIMTIDIGNGRKGQIRVFEGDDPHELARSFCQEHRLNPKIIDVLVQNIK